MSLDGVNLDRLRKMVALLSSNQDGEALAAVRAIGRTLEAAGKNWNDLAEGVGGSGGSGGPFNMSQYRELMTLRTQLHQARVTAEDYRKSSERYRQMASDLQRQVRRLEGQLEAAKEPPVNASYYQCVFQFLCANAEKLSPWEVKFTLDVGETAEKRTWPNLSERQLSKLVEIARRHGWND